MGAAEPARRAPSVPRRGPVDTGGGWEGGRRGRARRVVGERTARRGLHIAGVVGRATPDRVRVIGREAPRREGVLPARAGERGGVPDLRAAAERAAVPVVARAAPDR